MSQPADLFLRIEQETRGPFGPDVLAELARSGVITPATEASETPAGPWIPLQARGDYANIFPSLPMVRFKTRSFEDVNRTAAPPVDLHAIIAAANLVPPSPEKPTVSQPARDNPPGDVEQILRENARIQAQFEKPVDLTPRPNRRRFDYLVLMTVVNGFFIWRMFTHGDAITVGSCIGGIVISSAGITWLVYGVMDRY